MTTDNTVKADGGIDDERVKASFDLGFGTIAIDLDRSFLADDEQFDFFGDFVDNLGEHIAEVFEALAAKAAGEEA